MPQRRRCRRHHRHCICAHADEYPITAVLPALVACGCHQSSEGTVGQQHKRGVSLQALKHVRPALQGMTVSAHIEHGDSTTRPTPQL